MKKFSVFLGTFFLTLTLGLGAQSAGIFNMTDTWDDGGTTFNAIKMAVTDTASAADSSLINLTATTGGSFVVGKAGDVTADSYNGLDFVNYGTTSLFMGTTAPQSLAGALNVYIGDFALSGAAHSNTKNVVIGGTSNIGGEGGVASGSDGNIAIGWNAMTRAGTSRDDNIAIGQTALPFGGSYNIVVGHYSADNMSGERNISIGYGAGDTVTSANYGIMIGNNVDGLATDNNFLHIGNGTGLAVEGFMSPNTDQDVSSGLQLAGPDALAGAAVNQDGGDIKLKMGEHATGGGTAGEFQVLGPDDAVEFSVDEAGNLDGTQIDVNTSSISIGNSTTHGARTVAIGLAAGTSGSGSSADNVAIGGSAMTLMSTSAVGNIAIGSYALNTSSSNNLDYNIAIGYEAMRNNSVTTAGNIGIGYRALYVLASGANNTVIGWSAGDAINSGSSNTIVGYNAGTAATGSGNTFLGMGAGDATTSGGNNIVIGFDVDTAGGATASDEIAIGSSAGLVIAGEMTPKSDVDRSANAITITGTSAFPTASTNLDAGDLILQGGTATATGAGDGGELYLRGGTKGSTGANGLIIMDNLPTSDPTVAGALWNNSGVLTVSSG